MTCIASRWKIVKDAYSGNVAAASKEIWNAYMATKLQGKSLYLWGYMNSFTDGKVAVAYNGGKSNAYKYIIGLDAVGNEVTVMLDDGTSYTFIDGESKSKPTSDGQFVVIKSVQAMTAGLALGSKSSVDYIGNIKRLRKINLERESGKTPEQMNKLKDELDGIETTSEDIIAKTLFGSQEEKIIRTDSHEEISNKIWNNPEQAEDMFTLFEEIDNQQSTISDEEKKHNIYLKDLLAKITDRTSPILNEFRVYVNKNAEQNAGTVAIGKNESEMILNIRKGSSGDHTGKSATEVFMHELAHLSVEAAKQFRSDKVSNTIIKLFELKKSVRSQTTWKDFVVDGNETEAKAVYKSMFENDDSLSEFIAYGMTNAKVISVLKNLQILDKKKQRDGDGLWSSLSYYVIKMYDTLLELLNPDEVDAHGQLMVLAANMWEHNSLAIDNSKIFTGAIKSASKAQSVLDKKLIVGAKGISNLLGATFDKTIDFVGNNSSIGIGLSVIRDTAKVLNPFMSKMNRTAYNKTLTAISKKMDGKNGWLGLGEVFAPEGTIQTLINYLSDDDDLTTRIEKYGLINQRLDKERTHTINSVGKVIKQSFGGLSRQDQLDLTDVLIRNDVQALTSKYSIEDIELLMSDSLAIDNAIEKERLNLDKVVKGKKARNYMKSQAIGLGKYIASGIDGSNTRKNAYDIAFLIGLTKDVSEQIEIPPVRVMKNSVQIINRLATLEGLKRTNAKQKNTISTLIKSDPAGIKSVIGMHKLYIGKAIKFKLENNTKTYPNKGEIKDMSQARTESIVVGGSKKMEAIMKKKGYKKTQETSVSGLWLYVNQTAGLDSFSKQAVAKINENKKLHKMSTSVYSEMVGDDSSKSDLVLDVLSKEIQSASDVDMLRQLDSVVEPITDGYTTIYRDATRAEYAVSSGHKIMEKELRQDNKAPILLGKMIAEINEKESAIELNDMVYKTILNDQRNYKRGSAFNKHDYIEVGPDAITDGITELASSKDIYSNLPENIRKRILKNKEGNQYIAVRRDLTLMYFGARSPSIFNMKIPGTRGKTLGKILDRSDFGKIVVNVSKFAGEILEEIVSLEKVDIVIKTPIVLIDNIISNISYSIALGQSPLKTLEMQGKMFKATNRYLSIEKQMNLLEYELASGAISDAAKIKEIKAQIREIDEELKASPVRTPMVKGLFTAVIEDISDKDLVTNSRIENIVANSDVASAIVKNTPQIIKDGLNTIFITENTGLFRTLMMATQYSDFVARSARYNILVESGFNSDEAIKIVLDEFVNYNRLDGSSLRWGNILGFIWFTKYMFGSNKSMINKIKSRPSSMLAMMAFFDLPNPSDASFFKKDFGHAINGFFDTVIDGTLKHIFPPSLLEMIGVVNTGR